MELKYKNVTISGLPGAGSTTLMRALEKKLGWKGYSGGEFMRAYAIEKGIFKPNQRIHHAATDYEDEFDRKVDYGVREKLQTGEKGIYEAWLTGFMAQGIEGVLKVLVHCDEDAVRIDRIVNRDKVNVEEAKHHIFDREQKNVAKWQRMYTQEWQDWVVSKGLVSAEEPVDFWNPKLYDLVIDTFSHSREETLELTLGAVGYVEPSD